jgi:hypothetical protein
MCITSDRVVPRSNPQLKPRRNVIKSVQASLLPIGQRVTHFNGGPDTHGKGTIVGYNGVKANAYAQTNLKDTSELVAGVESPVREILVGGIANGFYDGKRYPYIVQFDPREEYPNGYKDVYGPNAIRPIEDDVS